MSHAPDPVDLVTIREQLNELPFREGTRQVLIGRLSERFPPAPRESRDGTATEKSPDMDQPEVTEFLRQLARRLAEHQLSLRRAGQDGDELYAAQQLRADTAWDLSWVGDALNWVGRVTTIACEMVVPGLVGVWLDRQFGTRFIALVGFALGIVLAVREMKRLAQ